MSSSPEPACGSNEIHISVCDVPLLAPRPLPYHSPTFLHFDLPDSDEDLSHPPYTHRPPKRKRGDHDDPGYCAAGDIHYDLPPPPPTKRRARIHAWRSRVHREQPMPPQQLPSQRPQQHYTCPSGGATTLDILSDNRIGVARDLGLSIDSDGLEWR
ncbi:hypothetical protein EV401DRAFT_1935425 [Pisolithus croceorrhizus]|nr:hypothetical protein EV401DRAFT_1935425 [Pisolithus croceorrhizus]